MGLRLLLVGVALTVVSIATPRVGNAERSPTEIDLKAAYCLKVTRQATIPLAEQARSHAMSAAVLDQLDEDAKAKIDWTTKDEIKKRKELEARLMGYLVPRIDDLEPAPMLAVMRQGEIDAANYRESLAKCFAKCPVPAPNDSMWNTTRKCGQDCAVPDELFQRIASCGNLDWLPNQRGDG